MSTKSLVPYVSIRDSAGNYIIDNLHQAPLGMFVTSFTYKYVSEGFDNGTIVIETDNPNIVSHPNLQYLRPLKLQWGWVDETGEIKASPVRSVVVKKHKIVFGDKSIIFTIDFCCGSFILQSTPSTFTDSDKGIVDWIKGLLRGHSVPIQVIDYSNTEIKETHVAKKINNQ